MARGFPARLVMDTWHDFGPKWLASRRGSERRHSVWQGQGADCFARVFFRALCSGVRNRNHGLFGLVLRIFPRGANNFPACSGGFQRKKKKSNKLVYQTPPRDRNDFPARRAPYALTMGDRRLILRERSRRFLTIQFVAYAGMEIIKPQKTNLHV